MKYKLLLIILFFSKVYSQEYISPMKIDKSVSGSFGELRPNHFHSGVDYRTFGKTDIKIYSIEDGYVSRVKVQVAGYGKALYITHPKTGQVSVFAHLNNFSDKILKRVKKIQYNKKSYTIDIVFRPDEIKVKKEEIIAYSGNTGGSMGPHLHFEIRDKKTQNPLNPFKNGFKEKDNLPPILKDIYIIPIKKNYNLYDFYQYKKILKNDKGNYLEPKVYSKFGIAIDAIDKINNSKSNNGIYSIVLKLENDTIFYRKMDRFSFAKTRYLNNLIVYNRTLKNKNIEKCFIPIANENLGIYDYHKDNGIIKAVKGKKYKLEIIISDENNNITTEKITLVGDSNPYKVKDKRKEKNIFLVKRQKKRKYKFPDFNVEFPKECFYENLYLKISKNKNSYTVGNLSIPSHKYYTLKIKDTLELSEDDRAKYFISYKNHKKFDLYLNTSYDDGYFVTRTRNLGDFKIKKDTTSPYVRIVNKKITKRTRYLRIVSKDNDSGIKKFNAFINGKWILTEYDYKQNLFKYDFYDHNIKGKINLRVEVEDSCGNKTIKEKIFYR